MLKLSYAVLCCELSSEGKFETVEEWSQHMDEIEKELNFFK